MNILGSKVNNKIRSILVLIVIPKTVPFLHSASGHDFPSITHHMPVEQGGGIVYANNDSCVVVSICNYGFIDKTRQLV
jgi:hypothetical protein